VLVCAVGVGMQDELSHLVSQSTGVACIFHPLAVHCRLPFAVVERVLDSLRSSRKRLVTVLVITHLYDVPRSCSADPRTIVVPFRCEKVLLDAATMRGWTAASPGRP